MLNPAISPNKKRVFIIHGWDGYPDEGWFPWLKKELEAKDFEVTVPVMPDAAKPEIATWVSYLSKLVGKPDENTYFVGHSIGCQAVIRYLETLDTKVGGAVFVAGWLMRLTGDLSEEEVLIAKPWIETPINYQKVKNNCRQVAAIFSDNDDFVHLDNIKLFESNLNASTVLEHKKGHYSGGDGITELPAALEKLLNFK